MSSSSDEVIAGLFAAGFGVFWVVYMAFIFALVIFFLICEWKIFVKAGEPGWAALIPFYNVWVLVKISCNNNVLWFILFLIGLALSKLARRMCLFDTPSYLIHACAWKRLK